MKKKVVQILLVASSIGVLATGCSSKEELPQEVQVESQEQETEDDKEETESLFGESQDQEEESQGQTSLFGDSSESQESLFEEKSEMTDIQMLIASQNMTNTVSFSKGQLSGAPLFQGSFTVPSDEYIGYFGDAGEEQLPTFGWVINEEEVISVTLVGLPNIPYSEKELLIYGSTLSEEIKLNGYSVVRATEDNDVLYILRNTSNEDDYYLIVTQKLNMVTGDLITITESELQYITSNLVFNQTTVNASDYNSNSSSSSDSLFGSNGQSSTYSYDSSSSTLMSIDECIVGYSSLNHYTLQLIEGNGFVFRNNVNGTVEVYNQSNGAVAYCEINYLTIDYYSGYELIASNNNTNLPYGEIYYDSFKEKFIYVLYIDRHDLGIRMYADTYEDLAIFTDNVFVKEIVQ